MKSHEKCRLLFAGIIISAILLAVALPARAAIDTWIGGTGNQSWTTGGDWSTGVVPQTGDSVVIGDATANRTITDALASSSTLTSLTLTQLTAGTSGTAIANVLDVAPTLTNVTLTDANSLVLGTSASHATVDLTLTGATSASASNPILSDAGGIYVNSGGALTFQFASTPSSFLVETGDVTIGSGGVIVGVNPTSTPTASFGSLGANNSLGGSDTFTINSGGVLQLQCSSGASTEARIQIDGPFDWAGTVQAVSTGATAGSDIILHGTTNTIASTAIFQNVTTGGTATTTPGEITLTTAAYGPGAAENLTQTLNTAVSLQTVIVRDFDSTPTNVYTHTLTYSGTGTGQLNQINYYGSGCEDVLQLGSNWKEVNVQSPFLASTPNVGATAVDNVFDLNGYTFDGTNLNGGWIPNKSGSVITAWDIISSSGTGTFMAQSFNLSLSGGTASDSISVGRNVVLEATGGNSTAITLSSGTTSYSINAGSTFLYSGTASISLPATLASSKPIGNVQVQNGALQIAGTISTGAGSALTVSSGGTVMLSGTLSGPGGGNSVINYPGAVGGTGLLNEGPLTVYGTLVAGNGLTRSSAGATLTIGNNVTLGDGSQFEVNLNDPSDKIDLLAINGSLTLDALSTLDVNLVNGSMISGSTYTVATFTPGDLTGEFGTVAFVGGSYGSYDIVYNNAAGVIDLQVASNNPEGESVPEPGVWAMMLGGFTIPGLLRFRRNA